MKIRDSIRESETINYDNHINSIGDDSDNEDNELITDEYGNTIN